MEDLFLLIENKDGMDFRYFLIHVINSDINLAAVLAFLPNETQEMVCRNVSVRNGGRLRKETKHAESFVIEYVQQEKQKLMDFIGDYEKKSSKGWRWWCTSLFSEQVIWKETESKILNSSMSSMVKLSVFCDFAAWREGFSNYFYANNATYYKYFSCKITLLLYNCGNKIRVM